jgi:eukaryotic-like serine/threonine-protein kinase
MMCSQASASARIAPSAKSPAVVWARSGKPFETMTPIKKMSQLRSSARAGGADVVRRFIAERQILATLDHPNIAHVIDGGTTSEGHPYFVMDYIDGEPIDSYCERESLTVAARLALFRTVCEAVHFAHQRLIVHRDLKPSNILVDRTGTVKLLDFGIAKLLDPSDHDGALDLTVAQAMTPAYASPEQIKRTSITTASDVYALGVILYRLLTGRSPYKSELTKPIDLAREIVETDPQRPSTVVVHSDNASIKGTAGDSTKLRQTLEGDLDTIVMMALRKEPNRRYASAEQMSDDVRRFLAHEPVLAHRDSLRYRARKFIRRNRAGVSFATLSVLALTAVAMVALYQAQLARQQKERAEAHFASIRKLANASIFEVPNLIKKLPGSAAVQKQLIENAVKYLDGLAAEKDRDFKILAELGAGYVSLSQIEGSAITQSNLGNPKAGRKSLELGISYLRGAQRKLPLDDTVNYELAYALRRLAEFEWYQRQFDASGKAIDEAISLSQTHRKANLGNDKNLMELAAAYVVKARTSPAARVSSEIRDQFVDKAIDILKPLTRASDSIEKQKRALQNLAVAYNAKAEIVSSSAQPKSAERAYELNKMSVELSEQLLALDPQNPAYVQAVAASYFGMAASASGLNLTEDATKYRRQSSENYGQLSKLEPVDQNAATLYAYTVSLLAEALSETDSGAAEVESKRAVMIQAQISEPHRNTLYFRATTLTIASVDAAVAATRSKSPSLTTSQRAALCTLALARYRDARTATQPLKELFLDQNEDPIAALKKKMELCRTHFGASVTL